ncbi:hypothetical protein TCAL_05876 [Tigriopus californicus]|uniref:Ig-like domain-containing protein n=1 Tax=Tigriopus californicus TaxID=6832 RepID=A0A553NNZ3_TIGCA|nr:hypothetical protein TCAL_05876 [Tigriopus californicus]
MQYGLLPLTATGGPSANIVGLPLGPGLRMDPYFVEEDNLGPPELSSSGTFPTLMRNISVNAGQTAFLECQVRNLGAKRVLWVRHRDVHILSVGPNTFTNDPRFYSRVYDDEGIFILEIRKTVKLDEGPYECQISTKPTKTFLVNLHVTVPSIRISGESSIRHLEQHSSLNLTCTFTTEESATNPQETNHQVTWFKNGQRLGHELSCLSLLFFDATDPANRLHSDPYR